MIVKESAGAARQRSDSRSLAAARQRADSSTDACTACGVQHSLLRPTVMMTASLVLHFDVPVSTALLNICAAYRTSTNDSHRTLRRHEVVIFVVHGGLIA